MPSQKKRRLQKIMKDLNNILGRQLKIVKKQKRKKGKMDQRSI